MSKAAGIVLRQVAVAIERRDWKSLTPLLHPYLHWTRSDGRIIRGRNKVLAYLAVTAVEPRARDREIRDGQIYRWVEP